MMDVLKVCERKLPTLGVDGLRQIVIVNTPLRKFAWTMLFLCCFVISAYTTSLTVEAYFENYSYTVTTVRRVKRLQFPAFFLCPKSADAINQTLVRLDVLKYLPNITEDVFRKLTAYSIAGAGIANMEPMLRTISPHQLVELDRMFHIWLGGRNLTYFFHNLFEGFGFTCSELLASNSDCDTFTFGDISIGAEISKCYHLNWVRVRWWKSHNCTIFHEWRNASQYDVCDPGTIVRDYKNIVNDTVVGGEKCLPACDREFREIVQDSRIRDGTTADDEMTISIHYGDLEYENVEEISVAVLPRFISELGGQANLFVGLSILVFVHICTDFYVWVSAYCIRTWMIGITT